MSWLRLRVCRGRGTGDVPVSRPVLSRAPVLSGSIVVGQTLTITEGLYHPTPTTVSYSWYRGGVLFLSGSQQTYDKTEADIGYAIEATETVSNSAGSLTTSAGTIGPIEDIEPSPPPPVPFYINSTVVRINSTTTVDAIPANDRFADIEAGLVAIDARVAAAAIARNISL